MNGTKQKKIAFIVKECVCCRYGRLLLYHTRPLLNGSEKWQQKHRKNCMQRNAATKPVSISALPLAALTHSLGGWPSLSIVRACVRGKCLVVLRFSSQKNSIQYHLLCAFIQPWRSSVRIKTAKITTTCSANGTCLKWAVRYPRSHVPAGHFDEWNVTRDNADSYSFTWCVFVCVCSCGISQEARNADERRTIARAINALWDGFTGFVMCRRMAIDTHSSSATIKRNDCSHSFCNCNDFTP